ncbi:DUF6084 family protein [Rhodococcoides kyotonense]|uniref:Uncharacterized protein n=1 Tax=Rhodococcoides kyotonense TaxID=398843 RepID=A0A239JFM0_9NOCA|nr:DUF6084 family protein [Rhodococcus kyotonensis]SNT04402.1 hypothetical protein SAMN05421642_108194 [Rhodococcus kyotonensis]
MTHLSFKVLGITPETYAAVPNLIAHVRITEDTDTTIHAMAMRAQVRIEPHRRRYSETEAAALVDMFGTPERWVSTLKSFQWMQTSTLVQGFTGTCDVDVTMPCTYDFDVTASRYLHAMHDDGTIPLALLFSGTVFTNGSRRFGVEQIPWDLEAHYDLPVRVWKALVRLHYPNSGWLRLRHDTLAALARYKAEEGYLGFDEALTRLLSKTEVR